MYGITDSKQHAPCPATLVQNELNSDIASFTVYIKPVLQKIRFLTGLTLNIAF